MLLGNTKCAVTSTVHTQEIYRNISHSSYCLAMRWQFNKPRREDASLGINVKMLKCFSLAFTS